MENSDTKKKIQEVGKREFLKNGFKDASLNHIVAEAGFTKGAFYGYYPDRPRCLKTLFQTLRTALWINSRLPRKRILS